MQGLLKKLRSFVAIGLVTVTTSCSTLKPTITESDLEKAVQTYSQKAENETRPVIAKKPALEIEQEKAKSTLLLHYLEEPLPESISSLDIKKKQKTLSDFLIPDTFSVQLNVPYYSLTPEKREVRFWNKVTEHVGYKGKIKSFSKRNPIENTFLELEGEYFFSRLTKEEWARRTSLGLKFSYGKDTIESHLTHPILLPLDIDITDELLGIGLNLNYYPEIKLKDILLRLTTGIDYKHLVVDADPKLEPFKIEGFDSEGCGLGYYLRIGIETIPRRIKILPKDTILFLAVEYRHEKIYSDPTSENIGPGLIFGIKKSLR